MIILDTDILIDLLRSNPSRLLWFEKEFQQGQTLSVSLVTKLELLRGCKNKSERKTVLDWLQSFQLIYISEEISQKTEELFEKYYPKQGIGILDAIIAATAISERAVLYTSNQKHFKGLPGLQLKGPDSLH